MEPHRSSLDLGWGRVSVLEWTPPRIRRDVVLLHGGGVDSAALSWGPLGSALADAGYHVLAPDHPGWGRSAPAPWPLTQGRLVAYVGELVDAWGLDDYVIGGLSLGGGMTIGHLLGHPAGVSAAMLFGAYGLMDRQVRGWAGIPTHLLTGVMLRTGMLSALTRSYARNRRLMADSLRALVRNPAERTPELLDAVMAEAARGTGLASFEKWQRDQFGWFRLRTTYLDRLVDIDVPVLLVHGARDTGVPLAYAREAARRLPRGQLLEVSDAGHWVQRDRPEVVTPAVLAFLDTLG